jgi:S1-C subfamily serine protease
MTGSVATAWTCACGRRVPPNIDRCRCGERRPPDAMLAEPVDPAGDLPDGQEADTRRPRLLSLVLGATLLVAAVALILAWQSRSGTRPSVPAAADAAPPVSGPGPSPDAAGRPAAAPADQPPPFRVELPPDLQVQPAATSTPRPPEPVPAAAGAEDVAQRVVPAVVFIEAESVRGSGFFAGAGLVLTNAHVVGSAGFVTLRLSDGQSMRGQVLRALPGIDLAVIRPDRVPASQPMLPLRPLGEVHVGEEVLAVGSALGVLQNTVTRGIVSAVRSVGGVTLVQTDAAINPGNSGGPLVDKQGWVVGITTLKITGQAESLGFAVAADHARPLLEGRYDQAASPGGTLQDRLQSTLSGDRSATDRARDDAMRELERQVAGAAQLAARIDASWTQYRAQCLQTAVIPRGYDREWFVLLDRVPQRSPAPACGPWTDDLTRAASQVRQAMSQALDAARRAGVFPGDQRDICHAQRLEWTGW